MTNNKLIGILLLAIMFTSPFAFASSVKLVQVSELKEGDTIVDANGNAFEIGGIVDYDDGSVGITGMAVPSHTQNENRLGQTLGGLGSVTGMVGDGITEEDIVSQEERLSAQELSDFEKLSAPGKELGTADATTTAGGASSTNALTNPNVAVNMPDYSGMTVAEANKAVADAAAQTPAESKGMFSNALGLEAGGFFDALATGVQWAVIAYLAGQMLGPMLGMTTENTEALSTAMAAGFGTAGALGTYTFEAGGFGANYITPYAGWYGFAIGVVIFLYMYKETDTEVVTFNCMPWQAPVGGDVCEECNEEDLICSEYRCKSLGQNCDIVNPGTAEEKCVNINPRDVNPPVIKPNYNILSKGHEYTNVKNSPPGPGFRIVNTEATDGCLKAFTPLEFGITADEPAQCKIDFNHTEKFDDMITFIGGNNLYSYNHTEKFSLPSIAALKNSSMVLENGKDLTFFIRCKDKNGNENGAEYAVSFCVDPSPDNTAPKVEATSVLDGGCVAENQDKAEVVFYTNEPADCRWSSQDQDYDNMQNTMSCSSELYQANAMQLFGCTAELTGIAREDTKFYVRCKDQPGADDNERNENRQSFEFSLRGSTGLKMKDLQPNGTVFGAVSPMPVELKVKTLFGCNNGQAICRYSLTGNSNDYIQFFDTNSEDGIHTQRLDLVAGAHEYFVQCIDEGGNLVENSATFTLDIDTSAPVVARIYEEDGMLKIVTVKDSECSMTFDNCDFSFDEGTVMPYANSTVHVAEWNEKKTYYIKCRDEFRNENADCSVIVRPSRNFL